MTTYEFKAERGDYSATGTDTQKRRAIRTLRTILREMAPGAKGEVRQRLQGRKRAPLIYQAHTNDDGKIIAEEL